MKTIEKHVMPFIDRYLKPSLYLPAVAQLKLAQHLGYHTMIVSNSPDFLVSKIAGFLQVDEWRATEYAVDDEWKLCGITFIMQGKEKAACAMRTAQRLGLKRSEISAYSDSVWDLPLLLAAGTPVAVQPDWRLRPLCEKKQWMIL